MRQQSEAHESGYAKLLTRPHRVYLHVGTVLRGHSVTLRDLRSLRTLIDHSTLILPEVRLFINLDCSAMMGQVYGKPRVAGFDHTASSDSGVELERMHYAI